MINTKKITILIPAYNEEKGVGRVIQSIPVHTLLERGYETEVIVIDNNSTDHTASIAKKMGVTVIDEKKMGKGNALITGFNAVKNSKYVVIIDADDTYKATEIPRLIEPLEAHFCDVVAGSRIGGKTIHESLTFSHRFGNWLFSFLVRQFYKANITDTLTGFIAFKKEALDDLIPHMKSRDFTIEMEMITKLTKLGYSIYSVPITYDKRRGVSKLNSISDGLKIFFTFLKNLNWQPNTKAKKWSSHFVAVKHIYN